MAELTGNLNTDVLLLGDTSFGENYQFEIARYGGHNLLETNGYDYCAANIAPLLANAKTIIANLETPLTNSLKSPYEGMKKYLHWGDMQKTPSSLLKIGVKTVSLANNHSLDYGINGLEQTLSVLDQYGISRFGAGMTANEAAAPITIKATDGADEIVIATGYEYRKSYGVLGHRFYAEGENPGINKWSKKNAAEQIASIRAGKPDAYIIAYPHWGNNYEWKTDSQTRLGYLLIDSGADIVIGHGAHAAQEIENYAGKWIIYSLGNFIFNSPGRYKSGNLVSAGFIGRLTFSPCKTWKDPIIKLYPILSDNSLTNYQPRPLHADEIADLKKRLAARDESPQSFSKRLIVEEDDFGCFFRLQ